MKNSKSIFRPIENGEDCTDIVIKIAAALAVIYVIVLLLIVGWQMMNRTIENEPESYRQQLIQREADPGWRAELKRLRKKHGYPGVIIYEPDKDPYYFDKSGRKCRLI